MRILDAHCHVFEYLSSFRGEGEIRAIGGGKARWANGQVVSMMPPELGDKEFQTETLVKFLKEKGVEKAVLLQGSFYGFHNEYVAEAMQKYIAMAKEIVGADKLIWGTDVPSVLVHDTYEELLGFVTGAGIFTEEELAGVLYDNAITAYQWK